MSSPGVHSYVIPLPIAPARAGWEAVAEPWMAPVDLQAVPGLRTIATVRPATADALGYEAAHRTAACLGDYVRATRSRGSRRRGEVMPPTGRSSGAVRS